MTSLDRHIQMLKTAFGTQIGDARLCPDITEIIVNPDGAIWFERQGERTRCDQNIDAIKTEQIIRLVASHAGKSCTRDTPIVSAELPGGGERFEGLLPPAVTSPCFVIRKPATRIYTLDDYLDAGTITRSQKLVLESAIHDRHNILIAGGTGSGKTTFVNALLHEISNRGDRLVLIEDTRELQCTAEDHTSLRTVDHKVTMRDLVRSSLRLRPDRIMIGEVRGAEALDLLKAWNTGHPGGIATIHANSAIGALGRLEQLIMEAAATVPHGLIGEAVDIILFLSRQNGARQLTEMVKVDGVNTYGEYQTGEPSIPDIKIISTQESV